MLENLYLLWWSIRNFFTRPFLYFGPTLVCCNNADDWKGILTVGKVYYSERRDMVSYYLIGDNGQLQEVVKTRLTLIKKIK